MVTTKSSLTRGRNWLVWQEKHKPVSCLTGSSKGWNRNLGTYNEALQFKLNAPSENWNLGYCFSDDADFIGLDLDACRNPETGLLDSWAEDVLEALAVYIVLANVSVSGTGIKLILKCSVELKRGVKFVSSEGFGDHRPQIEMFCSSKYFALTPFNTDDIRLEVQETPPSLLSQVMGYDVTEVAKKDSESTSGETTPDELAALLDKLDVFEFQDREGWIKIMQASHHATGGSQAGKEVFKKWSSGDEDNYSESDIERDWNSLRLDAARPVTVGTIIAKIPADKRQRIRVEDEFEVIKAPATRMLPWLLDETARNHRSVANQMVQEINTLRYVTEWGKWIAYVNGVWVTDVSGAIQHSVILKFVADLRNRIPISESDESQKAANWVGRLGDWTQTNGIIRQLRGEIDLHVSVSELNKAKNLLNFRNGTYDLGKKEFREHRHEDFCTQQCITDYVEGQVASKWIEVVDQIFGGDQELVAYVRRLLGKFLSDANHDPMFNIFYGGGCNGKSTLVQTVGAILGSYSCSLPSEMLDSRAELHPVYAAQLHGKRLAMFAEMDSDVPLSEKAVKKITSQDEIEARRMYEAPWVFMPTHTSIICTNHKPKVSGRDKGIWRRLQLIPFEVDLSSIKDVYLGDKLAKEYAGIVNWLIQGYREYTEVGIGSCKAVEEATAEYREDEDSFKEIAQELFRVKQGSNLSTSEAHSTYMRSGGRLGRKNFNSEMERIGFSKSRVVVNGVRTVSFTDIEIISEFGEV